MRLLSALFVSALPLSALAGGPVSFEVQGTANIFGAGHATPPAPDGGGGGTLPTLLNIPGGLGGGWVEFGAITGVVSCCEDIENAGNGADGGPFASGDTDVTSFGGISGLVHSAKTMFLVGVFVDDNEPGDPAPDRLVYDDITDGSSNYSPLLNQSFFIGDGEGDALPFTRVDGVTQKFFIPSGATRLYLGFVDAFEFGNPTNAPGFYDDNVGKLDGRALFIPAPGFAGSLGLLGVAALRRRR